MEDTLICGFNKASFEKIILENLTHEELGFLVGAHRVSITKAMKALKEAGRIFQEGRTLILSPLSADYPA